MGIRVEELVSHVQKSNGKLKELIKMTKGKLVCQYCGQSIRWGRWGWVHWITGKAAALNHNATRA